MFLTDARPNQGRRDEHSLFGMERKCANAQVARQRIYSTFIGIGSDFDAGLIEAISQTRGCNYCAVKSARELTTTMDAEFEHMVVMTLQAQYDERRNDAKDAFNSAKSSTPGTSTPPRPARQDLKCKRLVLHDQARARRSKANNASTMDCAHVLGERLHGSRDDCLQ